LDTTRAICMEDFDPSSEHGGNAGPLCKRHAGVEQAALIE
jgi:hypothetical protein